MEPSDAPSSTPPDEYQYKGSPFILEHAIQVHKSIVEGTGDEEELSPVDFASLTYWRDELTPPATYISTEQLWLYLDRHRIFPSGLEKRVPRDPENVLMVRPCLDHLTFYFCFDISMCIPFAFAMFIPGKYCFSCASCRSNRFRGGPQQLAANNLPLMFRAWPVLRSPPLCHRENITLVRRPHLLHVL
jgi:hypothetical protein